MKYLVDTNVWLEVLLNQDSAAEARSLFETIESDQLAITEFSLYSLGVILTRLNKDDVFADFLADTMENAGVSRVRLEPADLQRLLLFRQSFGLDFDDAYQYAAATRYNLVIVSFDRGFDRTPLGRKTPAEVASPSGDIVRRAARRRTDEG